MFSSDILMSWPFGGSLPEARRHSQCRTAEEVGGEDQMAEPHAGQCGVVAHAPGEVDAGAQVAVGYEFAAVHARRVAVVVVIVEERAAPPYLHGDEGCLLGCGRIAVSQHASLAGPQRGVEVFRFLHLHLVRRALVFRLAGHGMHHHHSVARVHADAAVGIVRPSVGHPHGAALNPRAAAQQYVANLEARALG